MTRSKLRDAGFEFLDLSGHRGEILRHRLQLCGLRRRRRCRGCSSDRFLRGRRRRLRGGLLGRCSLIRCRGLSDRGSSRFGSGRFRGQEGRAYGFRGPVHSHRLGLVAIMLPGGCGDRGTEAEQGDDDPLARLGCRSFPRRHDVADPDLIGSDAISLNIPDISNAEHRLDLRGGYRGHRNLWRDVHGRCRRLARRIVHKRRRPVVGAPGKNRFDREHVVRIGLLLRLCGLEWLRGLHWRGPLLQCHPHLPMRRCCGQKSSAQGGTRPARFDQSKAMSWRGWGRWPRFVPGSEPGLVHLPWEGSASAMDRTAVWRLS
ncbi:MAG: hypothetical protein C0480_03500 [Bradyrhizobium sp.]|nr:hypothetical protein [Bradyrhizobium sp.]